MLRTKITRLIAIVALLSSGSVLAVQFDNRSFEQGTLNGWEYIGDASAQNTSALGVTPIHGPHAALLTNANGSLHHYSSTLGVSPIEFITWLGYDVFTNPPPFHVAEIEGHSGLRQSVELRSGDVVSFDWNQFGDGKFDLAFAWLFPTNRSSPGTFVELTAPFIYPNTMNPWPCLPSEIPDNCVFATGWQSYSFVAPTDGNYTLTFGIFNRMDPGWLTALWLDDFKISRVPEPGSLALLGLGLIGLAFTRHRLVKPSRSEPIAIR